MKDAISVLQTLNSINFIKNIKEKINNQENATINEDYLAIIEKSYINDDILDEIVVALLNVIWTNEQDKSRNYTLKVYKACIKVFKCNNINLYLCYLLFIKFKR